MKVDAPVAHDNSLVYSTLLQELRQHAEIRRMFIWRNGMQQLHFCSQWDEELGVVPDRLDRIRQVASKKRMVVAPIEQSGLQQSNPQQQAAAIYRGFADASVLELHLLLSQDPTEMKAQVTKIEQAMQPVADHPTLHELSYANSTPARVNLRKMASRSNSDRGDGVTLGSLVKKKSTKSQRATQTNKRPEQTIGKISREVLESQRGLVDFFANINASLDRNETAFNIVSELRRETDADRVSLVAFAQQSRGKLVATSGVAKINRKGRETIQLEQLVKRICRQGLTFTYPGKEFVELPSDFRSRVESYLTNSSARSLMVIPITLEPNEELSKTDMNRNEKERQNRRRRNIAAIVIENFQSSELKPNQMQYQETLALRAGDAYRNAFLHQRAFLFPLWEFLGRQYDFLIGRHFSKTMSTVGVVAILCACMFIFHGEYRLACDGQLQPLRQRTIWAEVDGIVNNVHVKTGQQVTPGKTLVTLENKDLKIQQQEYAGNLFSLRQRLESVDRLLAAVPNDLSEAESDARQMSVERTSLVQQAKTIEEQLKVIEQQISAQTITSPIAGVVLTADLQRELEDRPVKQGTALLDVADVDGDWVLELKMPDRKVGELLKAKRESDKPLKVSFVRSSEPAVVYEGEVKTIDLSARIDDEVGQFLRLVAKIDAAKIPAKNVGMETVAYLHCGSKSYAYIWTKELVDFVNKHIIFPLF